MLMEDAVRRCWWRCWTWGIPRPSYLKGKRHSIVPIRLIASCFLLSRNWLIYILLCVAPGTSTTTQSIEANHRHSSSSFFLQSLKQITEFGWVNIAHWAIANTVKGGRGLWAEGINRGQARERGCKPKSFLITENEYGSEMQLDEFIPTVGDACFYA